VLDEAGGHHVKIISKIESWHGVINYDDILAVTGAAGWGMWCNLHAGCVGFAVAAVCILLAHVMCARHAM
jgi:hypothetical protein